MKILFVAGFGPITSNVKESRRLYRDVLGLPLEEEADDYLHTEKVEGVKGFGVWPLYQAAESCFGRREWPADVVTPQAWLEFDVEDVEGRRASSRAQATGSSCATARSLGARS